MENTLLNKTKNYEYVKEKGRPPFSAEMIRFALIQRYRSRQAYELLVKELPPPSISLLKRLSTGGIDPIKFLKILLDKGKVDSHCVLIVDEMYLQKSVQFHSRGFVGANNDGKLFKGIVCFMIVGFRKSIPYVVKSVPEVKIKGEWLKDEIETLSKAGFHVRAVVSDNHAVNVNVFNLLKKVHSPNKTTYITQITQQQNNTCSLILFT